MAKSDIQIEFIADFQSVKKGEKRFFSKDISKMFIDELKVAKLAEVVKEPKELKPKKSK